MDTDGAKREKADFIVIGSGIAGLRAALGLAEHGTVVVLTKDKVEDSSTEAAQGGVAVALSEEDRVVFHLQDTINAGDGLCLEEMVRVLVEEGPSYIAELISWGTEFDREGIRLAFTMEGAHSKRRILHAHGDSTGREIVRTLTRLAGAQERIRVIPGAFTVDLIRHDGRCRGVSYLGGQEERFTNLLGRSVLLATGGAGHVFLNTTNPRQATGDGMAIAFRAGAEMMDMEFVQFHPTALALEGAPSFLLSESIRGEGGVLLNSTGRRFMDGYHAQAELAPRDVVSRAILTEMKHTGSDHVLLDLTGMDADFVTRRFPTIHRTCLGYGLDITRDRIPVTPSAHYLMGGVKTDAHGRTTMPGLYAAGEVACTGVHGANRLASNSLLEGLVFGARSARAMLDDQLPIPDWNAIGDAPGTTVRTPCPAFEGRPPFPDSGICPAGSPARLHLDDAQHDGRMTMWQKVGITRCRDSLENALDALRSLLEKQELRSCCRPALETLNMLTVGSLIARAALRRTESRGSHYRTDYPERDDGRWLRHEVLTVGDFADYRLVR